MSSKKESRRGFLKKALVIGAAASVVQGAITIPITSEAQNQPPGDNGVIRGHSPKREVLYRITKYWKEYYRIAP